MNIRCENGHRVRAPDTCAGHRIHCPKCHAPILLPEKEPELFDVQIIEIEPDVREADLSNGILPDFSAVAPASALPSPADITNYFPPAVGPVHPLPSLDSNANSNFESERQTARSFEVRPSRRIPQVLKVGLVTLLIFGPLTLATRHFAVYGLSETIGMVWQTATNSLEARPSNPANTSSRSTKSPQANVTSRLTRRQSDPRLISYRVAGQVVDSAYDPQTACLALAVSNNGIFFYSLDDLMKGKENCRKEFRAPDVHPTLCFKVLDDKRFFLCSHDPSNAIKILDATTLKETSSIPFQSKGRFYFIHTSTDPSDPYVYVRTEGGFHRLDLRTNTTVSRESSALAFEVSPDGKSFLVSYEGLLSSWNSPRNDRKNVEIQHQQTSTSGAPEIARFVGDRVVMKNFVYAPNITSQSKPSKARKRGPMPVLLPVQQAEFYPRSLFTKRGIACGFNESEIVFGSINSMRRLDSVPLPLLLEHEEPPVALDNTYTEEIPLPSTRFVRILADEQLDVAICCTDFSVSLAKLAMLELPAKIDPIRVPTLPTTIMASKLNELKLDIDEGTKVSILNGTVGLPYHADFVGQFDQENGKWLAHSMVSSSQAMPTFRGELPAPPFSFMIGPEICRVQLDSEGKIKFTRSGRYSHGTQNRVFLLDENDEIIPPESRGEKVRLKVGIAPSDTTLVPDQLVKLLVPELPFEIQVGREVMKVTGFHNDRKSILVDRRHPMSHAASESIVVRAEPSCPMPKVDDGLFRWTPPFTKIGHQTLRLRVRRGNDYVETFQSIRVENGITEIPVPFYARGVSANADSGKAVVWGSSESMGKANILGVVDLKTMELNRQRQLDENDIGEAVCLSDGSCVVTIKPNSGFRGSLRRFDLETLELQTIINEEDHDFRFISNRYLLSRSSNSLIELPSLTKRFAHTPELQGLVRTHFDYDFSKSDDGPMLDGVLWDHSESSRQLMIFVPWEGSQTMEIVTDWGITRFQQNSAHLFTWRSRFSFPTSSRHRLYSNNGAISVEGGAFFTSPWMPLAKGRHPVTRIPISIHSKIQETASSFKSHSTTMIAETDTHLLFVNEVGTTANDAGTLHAISKEFLYPSTNQDTFRFVQKQSTFFLDGRKANQVKYDAPGASDYRLKLWLTPPFPGVLSNKETESESQDWKLLTNAKNNRQVASRPLSQGAFASFESKDGQFTIQLDKQALIDFATNQAKNANLVDLYNTRIRQVKALLGTEIKGLPIIVTALVEAKRGESELKTGMFHSYFVLLPLKEFSQYKEPNEQNEQNDTSGKRN